MNTKSKVAIVLSCIVIAASVVGVAGAYAWKNHLLIWQKPMVRVDAFTGPSIGSDALEEDGAEWVSMPALEMELPDGWRVTESIDNSNARSELVNESPGNGKVYLQGVGRYERYVVLESPDGLQLKVMTHTDAMGGADTMAREDEVLGSMRMEGLKVVAYPFFGKTKVTVRAPYLGGNEEFIYESIPFYRSGGYLTVRLGQIGNDINEGIDVPLGSKSVQEAVSILESMRIAD